MVRRLRDVLHKRAASRSRLSPNATSEHRYAADGTRKPSAMARRRLRAIWRAHRADLLRVPRKVERTFASPARCDTRSTDSGPSYWVNCNPRGNRIGTSHAHFPTIPRARRPDAQRQNTLPDWATLVLPRVRKHTDPLGRLSSVQYRADRKRSGCARNVCRLADDWPGPARSNSRLRHSPGYKVTDRPPWRQRNGRRCDSRWHPPDKQSFGSKHGMYRGWNSRSTSSK